MPTYPTCNKCLVYHSLEILIDQYNSFRSAVHRANLDLLTDHARGFTHGQLSALSEISNDLVDLLPYLRTEILVHQKGKGE